ncbi:MAG: DUF1592 domain-containing protein [Planctomycetota bacterium]
MNGLTKHVVWILAAIASKPALASELELREQLGGFLEDHCFGCHEGEDASRGFELRDWFESGAGLEALASDDQKSVASWEQVLLRVQSRQMPPPDAGQPDEAAYASFEAVLTGALDERSKLHPHAGATTPLRRLTRTEYQNAIRDLLAIDIDVRTLLPADASSDGFDNITVGTLSPLLMERYLTAATKIAKMAIGSGIQRPSGVTHRLPPDLSQQEHVDGLPYGTRGGLLVDHHFPRDGEYEIQVRLSRDRDELVEGLKKTHQLDVLMDRKLVRRFELQPIRGKAGHSGYDAHLNVRFKTRAGKRGIAVTFLEQSTPLLEIKREPFHASFNQHRHPRQAPAVAEVSVLGPFEAPSPAVGDSESRRRILIAEPTDESEAEQAAREIIDVLIRRAYRRAPVEADLTVPMRFFRNSFIDASKSSDGLQQRFERGIESTLAAILVNPNFLFRTNRAPGSIHSGETYNLPSIDVASRLSFFLWSSLPDDELVELAEAERLTEPIELEQQVRRMLLDARSKSLVDNFADQWLYLRNLPTLTPDLRLFPDFDHNLRVSFAEETKHLFADVLRRDASILELIRSDHAFLNERLAKHYGIPGVTGSHFRRVSLRPEWRRGGLLRQGSVLMATSYATRTSPTIRGAWVLENILGTPPPPPPPNVPAIREESGHEVLSFRDALARHREDESCASCHDLIDPVGFALDQYDAVGRWRSFAEGNEIDAEGRLPDGQIVVGVEELEAGILARPQLFVRAFVEKLMTFAIGRPMEPADGPAIRQVIREAEANNFRMSDLIVGITRSTPFLMRTSP